MPPASMSLWSRVSQCQQPLPCGFLGTFQYLGSSSNEQKDVDKSESVLGSSEEHKDIQWPVFCSVKWSGMRNCLSKIILYEASQGILCCGMFYHNFKCRCTNAVLVTWACFRCAKCMLIHFSCHTLWLHFGLLLNWYLLLI